MTDEPIEKKAKRVNLEGIYQITQIIAFVAIIASLFAIYGQIQQATKMENAASEREVAQRVAEYTRGWDAEEVDLFLIGLHDWDEAPFEARFTVDVKVSEYLFIYSTSFRMFTAGFISAGTHAGDETYLISMLRTPGGQKHWAYKQHRLASDYATYINSRMDALGDEFPNMFEAEPHLGERLNELLAAQAELGSVDIDQTSEQPDE